MLTDDDRAEIQRVIYNYCYALDEGRLEDLASLFADTGVWKANYGSATGPTEIARLLRELVPARPRRRHHVTNLLIDETEEGIKATSYYLVVREGEDGAPVVSVAGTYFDEFIKENGRWRFAYRTLAPAILGDMGLKR